LKKLTFAIGISVPSRHLYVFAGIIVAEHAPVRVLKSSIAKSKKT
jgi:hypothetical protein